jgi:hypothetical protein
VVQLKPFGSASPTRLLPLKLRDREWWRDKLSKCLRDTSRRRVAPKNAGVSLLTRKAGLSREEFVRHWLEVHAPLAYAAPGLRRYVQSPMVGERTRPDIPTTDVEVDGIAEK